MPVDSHTPVSALSELRKNIRTHTHRDEQTSIRYLMEQSELNETVRRRIQQRASDLVQHCRSRRVESGVLNAFLQEFRLSNQEGVALMCMAEALLRIPDSETIDDLIHEKILSGDWQAHLGHSDSLFVNASTLGLMFSGNVVSLGEDITRNPGAWLKRLAVRLGDPVIRSVVMRAMRIMGDQYVMGRNIKEAYHRGKNENPHGTLFSFDMLGEGARTLKDASRYFSAYSGAIRQIGELNGGHSVYRSDSISVKLSALYPRYSQSHRQQVMETLLPQITTLAISAKMAGLGLTIDAEESERLDISLDIFEALARDNRLSGWNGLGMVVQAYQKRAPWVIDWLASLALDTDQKFMVRLVKGAYWDREIKFAQERGMADYPVYTLKPATDLCYQVCAKRLFYARDSLYPQFATHNAYSVAFILEIAGDQPFEFQRLHGMGGLLYQQLLESAGHRSPLRIYAPVGAQRDLLPYLVRRLLENGANSSFINQLLDKEVPVSELVADPLEMLKASEILRHPQIPKPLSIYRTSGREGGARDNSVGIDLDNPLEAMELFDRMQGAETREWYAGPIINGELQTEGETIHVFSPAHNDLSVGKVHRVLEEHIETALASAQAAQTDWDRSGGETRAKILDRVAALLETNKANLMWLISREAGRTLPDALPEVREAVDFCRYYALKCRQHFSAPMPLPGPTGEANSLSLHGRGVFLCISPWNFPLAIFTGQVAAALVAGNTVIAKPAAQTPLIAAEATRLFHAAGVPGEVLHLLPGEGRIIGPRLVGDSRISGVAMTGSTDTASAIYQQLACRKGPIVPLIAETGGQNAMIVDSSALPEQVVDDVIRSAFLSAGQRCSALRVLYLQQDIAEDIIDMLKGALELLNVGDPLQLSTDIGPVIDRPALERLQRHTTSFREKGAPVTCYPHQRIPATGTFCGPCIIEIESIRQLQEEVFGPILHIIRYQSTELDRVLEEINNSGYGLTLGIHTRIESKAEYIFSRCRVGNTYVNRNMVGAVVGVQPFGGQGLSGTGPKAGGPYYLFRFATEKTKSVNTVAAGGNTGLYNLLLTHY